MRNCRLQQKALIKATFSVLAGCGRSPSLKRRKVHNASEGVHLRRQQMGLDLRQTRFRCAPLYLAADLSAHLCTPRHNGAD